MAGLKSKVLILSQICPSVADSFMPDIILTSNGSEVISSDWHQEIFVIVFNEIKRMKIGRIKASMVCRQSNEQKT